MNLYNLLKISYEALLRNKARALLTMLGIIIGIASVIAMVSLGQSSQANINNQLSSMGTNRISVQRQWQRRGAVNTGNTNTQSLTEYDVDAIIRKARNISMITPELNTSAQLIYGNANWPGSIRGGNEQWIDINKYTVDRGMNITTSDVRSLGKVVLLGKTVADNLFPGGEDPLGKVIRVGQVPVRVVGVLKSKGAAGQNDQDDIVIMPWTSVQKRILAIDYLHGITASARSESVADAARSEIENILREQHHLRPDQENDFRVRTQQEMLDQVNQINDFLTILLAAIASISLLVGGIGIMNIMYVTVTERTREIGLRMAIGAHNRDIMLQFLCESTILSLIGGMIGIFFGLGLSYTASYVLNWPFMLNWIAVGASFVVCAATGIFFGWYPARKAASLDPITALRYE